MPCCACWWSAEAFLEAASHPLCPHLSCVGPELRPSRHSSTRSTSSVTLSTSAGLCPCNTLPPPVRALAREDPVRRPAAAESPETEPEKEGDVPLVKSDVDVYLGKLYSDSSVLALHHAWCSSPSWWYSLSSSCPSLSCRIHGGPHMIPLSPRPSPGVPMDVLSVSSVPLESVE